MHGDIYTWSVSFVSCNCTSLIILQLAHNATWPPDSGAVGVKPLLYLCLKSSSSISAQTYELSKPGPNSSAHRYVRLNCTFRSGVICCLRHWILTSTFICRGLCTFLQWVSLWILPVSSHSPKACGLGQVTPLNCQQVWAWAWMVPDNEVSVVWVLAPSPRLHQKGHMMENLCQIHHDDEWSTVATPNGSSQKMKKYEAQHDNMINSFLLTVILFVYFKLFL